MVRKVKVSKELKIKACKDYDRGLGSFQTIADGLNVAEATVIVWYRTFKEHGEKAFEIKSTNKSYSKELKLEIINLYNEGYSTYDLSGKYNIAKSVVNNWINKYNEGIEMKDYNPNSEVYTMKKRQTTFEERLEIVKWVIKNNMNYKDASIKYLVPYASIYLWTKKYQRDGEDSLKHNKRGRKSKDSIDLKKLNEVERLKYELELERKKRERLEFELEIHKKKEEFARKLHSQK